MPATTKVDRTAAITAFRTTCFWDEFVGGGPGISISAKKWVDKTSQWKNWYT